MKTTRVPHRAAAHTAGAERSARSPNSPSNSPTTASAEAREFARLLADAERRAGSAPAHGGGRQAAGLPMQSEPQDARSGAPWEGLEAAAGSASAAGAATLAAPLQSHPAAVVTASSGPSQAQLAELAESLVQTARVVVVGDRTSVDVELASGLLGVHRVQVQRTGSGAVQISLAVDSAEGRKLLEARLDGLTAALDRRGLANASIAVEVAAGRPDEAAARPASDPAARPGQGDDQDGGDRQGDRHGEGRSRGRSEHQSRHEEPG